MAVGETGILTEEEREELDHPVIEDEDFDVNTDPLEELSTPTGLSKDSVDDDSGLLEHMLDDFEAADLPEPDDGVPPGEA